MIVPSKDKAKKLEKRLTNRFINDGRETKRVCLNQVGGGGGIDEGVNYIYLGLK